MDQNAKTHQVHEGHTNLGRVAVTGLSIPTHTTKQTLTLCSESVGVFKSPVT